jgi:uncharacterized protein YndB with AHSA1/START domain
MNLGDSYKNEHIAKAVTKIDVPVNTIWDAVVNPDLLFQKLLKVS